MNKTELIDRIAESTGEAKAKVNEVVDATINTVQLALTKGEKVTLGGLGTFASRARKARMGRNPRTGEAVKIPATTIPVFKAGQALKDLVSGRAKLSVRRTPQSSAKKKTKTSKSSKRK